MNVNAPGLDPGRSGTVSAYERARTIWGLRRRRAEHFNSLMFSDPAWDVLLHLFIHEPEDRTWSAEELAELTGGGSSTMQRWLAVLMDEQLVEPAQSACGAGTAIVLSERGRHSMLELFSG